MTAVSERMRDKLEIYTTDAIGQTVVLLASDLVKDISGRVLGALGEKDGAFQKSLKTSIRS